MPPTILPAHARNALLGLWVAVETIDEYASAMSVAGHTPLIEEARHLVYDQVVQTVHYNDDRPVAEYLAALQSKLTNAFAAPPEAAQPFCQQVLAALGVRIEMVCGLKLDPLTFLFDQALDEAVQLYRRHGVPVPDDVRERVEFKPDFSTGEPSSPAGSACVASAVTRFGREDASRSTVTLDLPIRWIDAQTLAALAFVLLHECVCHVLQDPWTSDRVEADESSLFAEGWMDFVALCVHQASIDRFIPWPNIDASLLSVIRLRQRAAAEQAHRARRRESTDDCWGARALGSEAAEFLLELLAQLPKTAHMPTETLLRLSLTLNAAGLDNLDREAFALSVRGAFRRETATVDLAEAVRSYVADANAIGFFHRASLFV